MTVIAEGVETKEQLGVLTQLGCEEVQGYYSSEPIPCDAFETSLIDVIDKKRSVETGNS